MPKSIFCDQKKQLGFYKPPDKQEIAFGRHVVIYQKTSKNSYKSSNILKVKEFSLKEINTYKLSFRARVLSCVKV